MAAFNSPKNKSIQISKFWLAFNTRGLSRVTVRALAHTEILLINLTFGLIALWAFYQTPSGLTGDTWLWSLAVLVVLQMAASYFLANTFWISQSIATSIFATLAYAIWFSGGIHSALMVWMLVVPLFALLTLGIHWAAAWLLLTTLHNVVQFLAVSNGWSSIKASGHFTAVTQPLSLSLFGLCCLMLAVTLYDLFYEIKKRRLKQRTRDLENLRHALRKARDEKDSFVANMGHELRTPMNAIMGLNSILIDDMSGQSDFASAALHIRESATQMLVVVNNILDIAQLEADRLSFHAHPYPLRATLETCIEPFYRRAVLKGLTFESRIDIGAEVWVKSDPQRLVQVVSSLLDNAVKFTDHGSVEVRVSRSAGITRVEVQDSGCGIQAADRHRIFDRFAQGFETTRSALAGAGLSLALCHHILRRQGGTMGLGSLQSQGTQVWVQWPMDAAQCPKEEPEAPQVPSVSAQHHAWHFLAVDDHPMNLTVLELSLQRRWPNVTVDKAHSGQEALMRTAGTQYDAILMDVLMPGMDGIDTTRRIRQSDDARIRSIPILGLTAYHYGDMLKKCLDAGMQAVLTKPLEHEQLKAQLERILSRQEIH